MVGPAAALLAAAIAGEPLLAHWTQTFMGGAAGFIAQFFPLFLLGARFGKLMDVVEAHRRGLLADLRETLVGLKRDGCLSCRWRHQRRDAEPRNLTGPCSCLPTPRGQCHRDL